jgi:hypothetical protein
MPDDIMTLEDFERACIEHDLAWGYSDDIRAYNRGTVSEARIRKAAEQFSRADVERIWNAVVDTKMKPAYRQQFYWQWPVK